MADVQENQETSVSFASVVSAVSERNYNYGASSSMSLVRTGNLDNETKVFLKARNIRTGAATKNEDYVLGEGPIVFNPRERYQPLNKVLTILPDDVPEDTERIIIYINSVEGGTIAAPSETTIMVIDESQIAKQQNIA